MRIQPRMLSGANATQYIRAQGPARVVIMLILARQNVPYVSRGLGDEQLAESNDSKRVTHYLCQGVQADVNVRVEVGCVVVCWVHRTTDSATGAGTCVWDSGPFVHGERVHYGAIVRSCCPFHYLSAWPGADSPAAAWQRCNVQSAVPRPVPQLAGLTGTHTSTQGSPAPHPPHSVLASYYTLRNRTA